MNATNSTNYRSFEYISEKIKSLASFDEYLSSITIGTARNYKLPIEEYIDGIKEDEEREECKKMFDKKITSVFGEDFKEIDEKLTLILDELETAYSSQKKIISSDDLVFLLMLASLGVKKKFKDFLLTTKIEVQEAKEVVILGLKTNSKIEKFLLRKRQGLFAKAFLTLETQDREGLLVKATTNEVIQKYFFQKNNYEKINITTLKKILEFYFSKTLKGI